MTADVCVVVPTVRNYECVRAYLRNARAHGFDRDRLFVALVTEDDCDTDGMAAMLADEGVSGRVFDGRARAEWFEERGLGTYADLIPAASHAQTSFGLCVLWAGDFEYGVFVDDDTRPHPDVDFFGRHLANLEPGASLDRVRSTGRWVNVLHQGVEDHGLYPRGYPYGETGERTTTEAVRVDDPVISQGLWTGVPDLDAVRILQWGALDGRPPTRLARGDYGDSFVVEAGSYLTVCSMNLAFRREVVPAFYQLPMDDNPWGVGRFDDIWSGVFVKRACDVVGSQVVTGHPLCVHEKASRSTFDDLAAEAPALELNEHLWTIVDDVGEGTDGYAAAYRAMADALADGDWSAYRNGDFLGYVSEHMHRWLDCLEALRPAEAVPAPGDD